MKSKSVFILRKKDVQGDHHKLITTITSYYHDVIELNLEDALKENFLDALMIIVDIAPDNYETISSLKNILRMNVPENIPTFFILSSMKRIEIIQANNLGATDFLSHPIDQTEFKNKLEKLLIEPLKNHGKI